MTLKNTVEKGNSEGLDLLEFDESGKIDISWNEITWINWRMYFRLNGVNQILGWSSILVKEWFITWKWRSLFINIISWGVMKFPSPSLYLNKAYLPNPEIFEYWLSNFLLKINGDCVWNNENIALFLRSLNLTIWNKIVKFSSWEINVEEKDKSLIPESIKKYWLIICWIIIAWLFIIYEDFSNINWNIQTEIKNWKSSVGKILNNWWSNTSFDNLWVNSDWVIKK